MDIVKGQNLVMFNSVKHDSSFDVAKRALAGNAAGNEVEL